MHIRRVPSGFGAKTTGNPHGLEEVLISPSLKSVSSCRFNSSNLAVDRGYAAMFLGGASPVSMPWCTPRSGGRLGGSSVRKTPEYRCRRSRIFGSGWCWWVWPDCEANSSGSLSHTTARMASPPQQTWWPTYLAKIRFNSSILCLIDYLISTGQIWCLPCVLVMVILRDC